LKDCSGCGRDLNSVVSKRSGRREEWRQYERVVVLRKQKSSDLVLTVN
jgi:hypothetical protein